MKAKSMLEQGSSQWNKKMLRVFWYVVLFSFVIACVNSFLTERPFKEFFVDYIFIPTLLTASVVGATQALSRWLSDYMDYIMIVSASLIAVILISVHSGMPVIFSCLFFPLLISTTYFEKRKVWFSFAVSVSFYGALTVFSPERNDWMERVSMIAVLFFSTIVCLSIMRRGHEIGEHLKKARADHLELMVKSTLMEKQVKTDALTGLYNHMAFYEYINVLIHQAETYHFPLHLAILDIDNFKKINDSYGHASGDQVLKRVAECLRSNLRADDFSARYGGEEFVVILNGSDSEEAYLTMERIRKDMASLKHPELKYKHVTVSIGLETYKPGMHKQSLFDGADTNLYTAKNSGKNKTVSSCALSKQRIAEVK
ncbi:GGDEF domain-containing protein [Fictibacillus iocasae]|uniref:GGDEF domain-containing protein n=1 Tax=Fictibacillus iocasae TaxID=2715437 RepID=A0ABW2NRH5_9BACL